MKMESEDAFDAIACSENGFWGPSESGSLKSSKLHHVQSSWEV